MTLERSEQAKKAKSVFFRDFNDIDIYVEDTAKGTSKFYAVVFERALGGTCRVDTVFPLGGKEAVLRSCAEDQAEGGRPRLYVVDGDLDLLLGQQPPKLRRLLILPRYSLENYLIDEEAIVSLLDEDDIEKTRDEIIDEFSFDEWLRGNIPQLIDLFVIYAIAREKFPDCPTVGYPVNSLISSNTGITDSDKVVARRADVIAKILEVISEDTFNGRVAEITSEIDRGRQGLLSYVSGKDYLFPLIIIRMRRTTKLKSDHNVIKQRLAMRCDLSELSSVVDLIE